MSNNNIGAYAEFFFSLSDPSVLCNPNWDPSVKAKALDVFGATIVCCMDQFGYELLCFNEDDWIRYVLYDVELPQDQLKNAISMGMCLLDLFFAVENKDESDLPF